MPAFCPALNLASSGALQRSPVFVDIQIAIAEWLWCKLRSTRPSAVFFKRRSSAYRTARDLLSDVNASFHEKSFAMMCLLFGEHAIGRQDLQQLHLRGLHKLIQNHGGLRAQWSSDSAHTFAEPYTFAIQYFVAEYRILHGTQLAKETLDTFFSYLKRIRIWALRRQHLIVATVTQSELDTNKHHLYELRTYLSNIIAQYIRSSISPNFQAAGAFQSIFTLCSTMVEFDLTVDEVARLLKSIQYYMKWSVGSNSREIITHERYDSGDFRRMHRVVAICLVHHLLRDIHGAQSPDGQTETLTDESYRMLTLDVCEAARNAMMAFHLLDVPARVRITRALLRTCMTCCEQTLGESFHDDELNDLRHGSGCA